MNMDEYVDISFYCTLKVGGQFRYLLKAENIEDLRKAYVFANEKGLPLRILGGGSNMVFPDGVLENVIVKIEIKGFEIIKETDSFTDIKIGAGENWDAVVEKTVNMNLSGIEALSAIPGTAGATPVQNVGAYGQEIKNTLLEIEVFDINQGALKTLSNNDCKFSYRDSIFKNEAKGKYVITGITLRLSKSKPTVPDYPGVKKYFEVQGITDPSLKEIRQAIISIRSNKLPDPKLIPNVGSFFKNPIVSPDIAEKLKEQYPNLTTFPIIPKQGLGVGLGVEEVKIPAGWLIETAELKGKSFGTISTYQNNTLVLINNGGATRLDVDRVKNEIIKIVYAKFSIILEPEPEFV